MSRRWVALALAGVLAVAVGRFAVWTESCRVTRWEGESVYDVSLQPGVPGQVLLRDASEHGGGLTSIDADTGETIWHIDVDDEYSTTLVTPEWIIVESEDDSDSTLRALNPSTDDELWHVGFDSGSGSPALAGDVVLVDAKTEDGDGKDLVAYGVTTGELRWSAPAELPIELAGGALAAIMATGEGDALRLTALDPRTGEQMWTTAVGRDGSSTPSFRVLHVLDEGVLVAVDSGYVLLDATTGATRWTAPGLVDSAFDADPLVMHDPTRLLLYGQDRLITVNVETGAVSAPSSDDVYVFTTSPTGVVVVTLDVTLDTGRVDVLTGGR